MAKKVKQDLTGYSFIHTKYGRMTVIKEGKPYDGNCDIRVSWECVQANSPHTIVNLPARYIKRYEKAKD